MGERDENNPGRRILRHFAMRLMKREDRPRNVYERARKTKRQVGERHGEERRRRMHTVGEKEEKEGRE